MSKVICIGSSAKDIFFPTSEGVIVETPEDLESQKKIAFEAGSKYHIEDRFESLGGCAVNQACGLQRLGAPASCYTVLGSDMDADWIKKEIQKEGVDDSLIINENCPSGLSAIIVDQRSGERIIFSNQEANERMKIDPEKLKGSQWISVSDPNGDWKGIMEEVITSGAKVAFNPRGRNIKEDAPKVFELAGKCEILFVNKDEAIEIMKSDSNDEEILLKELKKSGVKIVAITDGERGAWATDGENMVHIEAVKIDKAVDTTGAGDAFASGFLAAYIKEKDLETCVRWGIQNGASVVKYYGGVEGLLKESEIS